MSPMKCETQKLRNIVILEKGKPPSQQSYFGSDAELYLTPEFLRGKTSAELVKPSANAIRVEDGDTIVLWDGSNAGEFFRARKGILASTMSRISHDGTFDKEYFFYAVKNWESYLKGQTSGSGIPHVDKEILGKLEICQFIKVEQTKIAAILSTVDRAIERTEALIAKQQRIKTGLMQDFLTCGIDEHGHLLSEQTRKFKDSSLGRIPSEWEVTPAIDMCDAVIDCKNRTPPNAAEGHPVIRTPNVRDGRFVYADLDYTDPASYEIWVARGRPRANDVVITREAPFGEACLIPDDLYAPCLGQRMMMYQPNPAKLRADYLVFAIYSEPVQRKLLELSGGSTVGHIRVGDIRRLPIPHPKTIDEQKAIAEILTSAANSIRKLEAWSQKLRSLKTALMQDLLTGKKRVTALLNDTAAAAS